MHKLNTFNGMVDYLSKNFLTQYIRICLFKCIFRPFVRLNLNERTQTRIRVC
ncbi:hypothetical protein Hanom_Chr11g00969661 [Helianthus anomalus]